MLFAVVIVTSIFSPLILNDVVVLILTPVIIRYTKESRIDAAPLLVAEITFTNIASSLTPLGNPQNILLWSASGATFLQFVAGTWFPLLLSGCLAMVALLPLRKRLDGSSEYRASGGSIRPGIYLALVIFAVVASDFAGVPSYVALGVSFMLGFGFTFKSPQRVRQGFDVRSLLILYSFVASITIAAILIGPALSGFATPVADGTQPYSALFVGVVSNLISNVPATQLVLSITSVSPHIASQIAVEAGLAGNIGPVGSFANLLALLMAKRAGLPLRRLILLELVVGTVAFLPAFI